MQRWLKWCALMVVMLTVASCDSISDSGFVGKWSRPAGKTESIVSIAKDGDGYTFCWSRPSFQGLGGRHECASASTTEVFNGADLAYLYEFTVETRDGSDDLFVSVNGIPKDDRSTPMHYVDRLELQPGGLAIWSYQIELNHVPRETPGGPYRFTKISDNPR